MILSVPVGKDEIMWNAGRVYGEKRLPLLLQGWTLVDSFGLSAKVDYLVVIVCGVLLYL